MSKNTLTQLKRYFSKFPSSKYPKGTLLHKPGDKFDHIYFVKTGFVRVYIKNGDQETTLNLFRPLFMISLVQSATNHPSNFYIETITPCEIWSASVSDYQKYVDSDAKFAKQVNSFFFNSVLQLLNNQTNIISGNATNKVATVLLQLAFDYGQMKDNKLFVAFPATHRVIASLIGLTRETTSVQMSKLQKMGVIATRRASFTVLNLDKLKKLSQLG